MSEAPPSPAAPAQPRGLVPHLLSCFAGASIDNIFRQAAAVLFLAWAASQTADQAQRDTLISGLVAWAALTFIAPFVLLAPLAGDLGDRLPKQRIMRAARLADLAVIALGALAIATHSFTLIFATLALLGCASAFFGTVKLSALPEIAPGPRLGAANGLVAAVTVIAILAGQGIGLLADPAAVGQGIAPWLAVTLAAGAIAALGVAGAWLIPALPAAEPGRRLRPFDFAGQFRVLGAAKGLTAPMLSLAGFWALGCIAQLLLPNAKEAFHMHAWGLGELTIVISAGIAAGSLLAPRIMARAFPAGLPIVGAIIAGASLAGAGLLLSPATHGHAANLRLFEVLLFGAGLGAGLWEVPLTVLVQERAPAHLRNQAMAALGVITSIGILGAGGLNLVFTQVLHLDSGQVYGLVGGSAIALAMGAAWIYRVQLVGFILTRTMRYIFRLSAHGVEHLPAEGGCLLVCNHLSYADGLVLSAALPRPVRFMVFKAYVDMPVVGAGLRWAGVIPVGGQGRAALLASIEAAVAAAQAGEVVAIFPEGKLTRSGLIDGFQRGMERIASRAGVPVVPAHLHGLWGSWMSHARRRGLGWWPRLRRPLEIRLGAPLPAETSAAAARVAVMELSFRSAQARAEADRRTLGSAALLRMRRHPFAEAVRDAGGAMSHWQLCAVAKALVPSLGLAPDEGAVGILLPPGRAGAIANLAVAMAGRTAVNLNHTTGPAVLATCCRMAGVRTVISAKAYLKRIPDTGLSCRMLMAEDLLPALGKPRLLWTARLNHVLPASWRAAGRPEATAAIVFSSGSTGDPKGVELTHRQILANCSSVAAALDLHANEDCLLSPLPLFHSFGLVPGMWLGLVEGLRVAGQPDPTDGKALGVLAQAARATLLISTPTFVRGYLRRIDPAQFASLRFAVVGAERCPEDLKVEFKERYKADLLEGYGCTELAPTVATNLPMVELKGEREIRARAGSVGRPLPGMQALVIDPETRQALPPGREGMIIIRSPSRMRGYLGRDDLTAKAFVCDGYETGDVGKVDDDGFLFITGRLARFAKVGGEMVPLDRVESELGALLANRVSHDSGIELAVSAVPDPARGERLVVLHTGWDGDFDALIAELKDLPPLWRPRGRDCLKVAAIPKLGTGKRDLGALKRLALASAGTTDMPAAKG